MLALISLTLDHAATKSLIRLFPKRKAQKNLFHRRERPGPSLHDDELQPPGADGRQRPQGVDGLGRESVQGDTQDLLEQLLRDRADHADEDVPASVRVCAEGGRRGAGRGDDEGLHAAEEEEEEAQVVVGALQEDSAEEGVE